MSPTNTTVNTPLSVPKPYDDLDQEAQIEPEKQTALELPKSVEKTPHETSVANTAQNEEEQKAHFEELLKSLEKQLENKPVESESFNPQNAFKIPKGLEHLFKAPLNRELLDRDYNMWFRMLKISKFIYSQSALQFQGITTATAVLGLVAAVALTQYGPLGLGLGLSGYSAFCAAQNIAAIFFGADSLEERKALWNEARHQSTIFASLGQRVSCITGTTSLIDRVWGAVKGGLQMYFAKLGYDTLFGVTDSVLTKLPANVINLSKEWALPLITTVVGGGISYFGMMIAWTLNGEGIKRLSDDFKGFGEDLSFSGELDRLLYISEEEYLDDLAHAMGLTSYAQLKHLREAYQENISTQVELRKYPFKEQIKLDPLKDLSSLNTQHPEDVLKPVLAQLIVLKGLKEQTQENYQSLIERNYLTQAQKVLTENLKPLIYQIEFLKHMVLDPARPPIGNVSPDGSFYYSFVSLLAGSEIKWDLKASDPVGIEEEANEVFMNEAAIQKIIYHSKGKDYVEQRNLVAEHEATSN